MTHLARKPPWLRAKLPVGPRYAALRENIDNHHLHTVCESARCPNMGECWSRGTATVMILGDTCTRSCGFCAVKTGRPPTLDLGESLRVARSIAKMKLKHVVITSVARDDLKDGGAAVWASTIRSVRHLCADTSIEVLPADFRGRLEHLDTLLDARPDIFNHNMETVERLQRSVRKTANYSTSLKVLSHAKKRGFITKTGAMLGLGEKEAEIHQLLKDLRNIQVNVLTLGQYLRPSPQHLLMDRWVTPEEFATWKKHALKLGFDAVESGPLVRSSYHADKQVDLLKILQKRRTHPA